MKILLLSLWVMTASIASAQASAQFTPAATSTDDWQQCTAVATPCSRQCQKTYDSCLAHCPAFDFEGQQWCEYDWYTCNYGCNPVCEPPPN